MAEEMQGTDGRKYGFNRRSVAGVKLKRAQVVRWIKPQQGRYKLNTDGSSSPGASSASLLRDANDSRWCLDELLKILECKEMVKQFVLPLFYDVDPSHVRHQKESFGEAFSRVEYKFKADKVKLTKWKVALEKVSNLSEFEFGDRDESEFIQDIIKWVDSKMVDRTPLNVATY
ncbi:TMV resistance protein N-like [Carya illinoinensis]|uniref:TMV resistance protein N-like n=1 Tax=Carya illinoinensis TaxID=32201 RepID=UPI001C725EED|nr:TMV resistance protein N-like [Carya illinoinensis]